MKREAVYDFFVVDHIIRPASDMTVFDKIPSTTIYEVIQIRQGVPLFFEEHMERFQRSAILTDDRIEKSEKEILEEIAWLVEKNRCNHINVKLLSARVSGKATFLTYLIPTEYPGPQAQTEGVHSILFSGERISPNIKTIKGSFRDNVRAARRESNAYEALLTDENGYITEGSRSNVFFAGKDGRIYTPPSSGVLMGVTRAKVIEICDRMNRPVLQKNIHKRDLSDIQGAFITGTTVDVTPLGSIDDIRLDSAKIPVVQDIVAEYENEIINSIKVL